MNAPQPGGHPKGQQVGSVENVRHAARDPRDRSNVERLLIVQSQDGADGAAAGSELQDLPGVVEATLNATTGSFDVLFDPAVVSDDELAASLHHQGYELASWQEVRAMHPADQRTWLLEQIRSRVHRAHHEGAEPGAHADGVIRGSVDAYVRAARAFGLVTDAEIVQLIPARFLEGPH